ncbi:response regulator transcription factor [Chloroflexia bacterium SDU3-3]|nr:response regulator transcription factor [Chloroflexia bacterium SDU3-3]
MSNEKRQIGVLIADDHAVVRLGLRMTIAGEPDMRLLGEASDGQEAVAMAAQLRPDVILLDIEMPRMDGVEAAIAIRAAQPHAAILMLTSYTDDARLYAAMRTGALGYLLKEMDGDALVDAIRGAARGNPQLHPTIARRLMERMAGPEDPFASFSQREREVLRLIVRGLSNKEIGGALSLAEYTVKGYVRDILRKLYVADRTQAALIAVRYGLVRPDDLPELGSFPPEEEA